jgi:subtilisin family serine protease
VFDWYLSNGKPPSIISMSLGGECVSYEECTNDILVQAVEALSKVGIIVVTAAGNSDCDSCLQTPAFAPSAITVGTFLRVLNNNGQSQILMNDMKILMV